MSNSQLDINQLMTDLEIESVEEVSSTDLSIPIKQEITVDPETIYNKLNGLINTGDKILKTAEYFVTSAPDSENISSAASLISSVRDVIHEFTIVHRDKLKFDQQMKIEEFKAQQKKELFLLKQQMNDKPSNQSNEIEMMEYSQESIIDALLAKESE